MATAQAEKFEVRNRWTNRVQFTAEIACAPDASIRVKLGLALQWAAKNRADLRGADLRDAVLRDADLRGADLRDAVLRDADLRGADLRGAVGLAIERVSHLASLKFMPGSIYAFKVVNECGEGHVNGGLKYEIGQRSSVDNANPNLHETCGAGVNVADLPWCLREWREGYRILVVEHTADDIACVPLATDGKYRLHGCTPVKDITDDLRASGALPAAPVLEAAA